MAPLEMQTLLYTEWTENASHTKNKFVNKPKLAHGQADKSQTGAINTMQ